MLFPVSSKLLSHFFEDLKIFFSFILRSFSNFFIFAKFLLSFLRTIQKFLCIPKLYKEIRNTIFFQLKKNFFINDNKSKLLYYSLQSPFKKTRSFSQNISNVQSKPISSSSQHNNFPLFANRNGTLYLPAFQNHLRNHKLVSSIINSGPPLTMRFGLSFAGDFIGQIERVKFSCWQLTRTW